MVVNIYDVGRKACMCVCVNECMRVCVCVFGGDGMFLACQLLSLETLADATEKTA